MMPPSSHPSPGVPHKVEFALIDSNRLAAMGLQHLLHEIIPMVEITAFVNFEEFVVSEPERFMHYFVSSGIFFEHAAYFQRQAHRSIVLVQGDAYPRLAGLVTLNVSQSEAGLARSILALHQMGHQGGTPLPEPELLSPREIEVAILLAKGLINKEVADRLHISLTTVISHRKNIMDKLHARSIADIIIYVVLHGLVALEDL
ncbi:MAG: helix-turn-helix transcriptional regulator [Bacteroidaceae bacterium]|nr:helix-turn-helix transcriptional regulator [Bacteroidaceae bacterium]